MLKTMNEKCENFLEWLVDVVEPVYKKVSKYSALNTCMLLGIVFMFILSCILYICLGGK